MGQSGLKAIRDGWVNLGHDGAQNSRYNHAP